MFSNKQNTAVMTYKLENLSIGYRGKEGTKVVASAINATIKAGELTCLIGANGAGKSTLLRTLAAFLPRLGGEIKIDDTSIDAFDANKLSKMVSVVLTTRLDTMNMTVRDIVSLGRTPYTNFWGTSRNKDKEIVEYSMQQVGLSHLATRFTGTLSDGERQKMMIAKALAQETQMIILDEPTAFLDYPSKIETMQLLRRLSRESGKTIFMSSHDFELVLQTTDSLWLMTKGKGINIGSPQELSANGALSTFIDRKGISYNPADMRVVITD